MKAEAAFQNLARQIGLEPITVTAYEIYRVDLKQKHHQCKHSKMVKCPHKDKTDTYLDKPSHTAREFINEIKCMDDNIRAPAYEHFMTSIKIAYGHLYPQINTANVQTVLDCILDKDRKFLLDLDECLNP